MPQNIFKIYDGRTYFWQWDTNQKLIVLDDTITEVQFSNRDMNHSITKCVYEKNGVKMCDIPDTILQLPKNLVAYAYADGATVKCVKFAVMKRPIPEGYVAGQTEDIEDKLTQIDIRLDALDENKADNIYYDEDTQSIQLTSNGRPIGDAVDYASCGIKEFHVDENDNITITLVDGRVIDLGQIVGASGATFIPHISDDLILSWTNDKGLDNPPPVDLSPFNDWVELGDDGETSSQYTWEFID